MPREQKTPHQRKERICNALVKASRGARVVIDKSSNACFGAAWHMGFRPHDDATTRQLITRMVVEGEKAFASAHALHAFEAQLPPPPDNSHSQFVFEPLERATHAPLLVVVLCDPATASRLTSLGSFPSGRLAKIAVGGPTCRMSIVYPLATGEITVTLFDPISRALCRLAKEYLAVSIPYRLVPEIIAHIPASGAGTARIEFPRSLRDLLR